MKKSVNKFVLFLFVFTLLAIGSYAQCYKNAGGYGRGGSSSFSLELGAGMPILITPANDSKFGDNKKFELGLRFLPEGSNIGLRGYYGYAGLSDSGAVPSDYGNKLKIHRAELQGIYMLNDLFGTPDGSVFELESYLGLGAAMGKSSEHPAINKLIATTIGLRPRFLIDDNRLHVYVDTSYGMLLNQQYDYAGKTTPSISRSKMGTMLHLSVGLSYRL